MVARNLQHESRTDIREHRFPSDDIVPLFASRWSPRAMTGEPMAEDEFMPLFEAAKLSPSYNNHPWRFLSATSDSDHWDIYLDRFVRALATHTEVTQ